jgi:hypothetical protein
MIRSISKPIHRQKALNLVRDFEAVYSLAAMFDTFADSNYQRPVP